MEKREYNITIWAIIIVVLLSYVIAYLIFSQALNVKQNELDKTKEQLLETHKELTNSQEENRDLQKQLKETQDKLDAANNDLANSQKESQALKKQLTEVQNELDAIQKVVRIPFLPCNQHSCGGFVQNVATLGMGQGMVAVLGDGQVRVSLSGVRVLATGQIAANKGLQVFLGSFEPGTFNGGPIGQIITDEHGDFNGTIDTGAGTPFVGDPRTILLKQFVLNDPGIRSEFYTEPQR